MNTTESNQVKNHKECQNEQSINQQLVNVLTHQASTINELMGMHRELHKESMNVHREILQLCRQSLTNK